MGISNVDIYTGQIKRVRAQATAPTSPAPAPGELYIDNTAGVYALGVYINGGWLYISLRT